MVLLTWQNTGAAWRCQCQHAVPLQLQIMLRPQGQQKASEPGHRQLLCLWRYLCLDRFERDDQVISGIRDAVCLILASLGGKRPTWLPNWRSPCNCWIGLGWERLQIQHLLPNLSNTKGQGRSRKEIKAFLKLLCMVGSATVVNHARFHSRAWAMAAAAYTYSWLPALVEVSRQQHADWRLLGHGSKIKCDLATAASAAVRLKATFLDQTVWVWQLTPWLHRSLQYSIVLLYYIHLYTVYTVYDCCFD